MFATDPARFLSLPLPEWWTGVRSREDRLVVRMQSDLSVGRIHFEDERRNRWPMQHRNDELSTIQWERLLQEFAVFQPPHHEQLGDSEDYVLSLIRPCHPFVEQFIAVKTEAGTPSNDAVRDLYHYLLEKRYQERLNLLHFAFHIFDDETRLPDVIIGMTPFPHEEGVPKFRHFTDRQLKLGVV